MKARLILEDGTVFKGKAFGYLEESVGEVVFNTSMTGYGEVLTDPSYYGQIVTMTYPLIGNYGINLEDVQSRDVCVKGFIVREKSDTPNNFRNEMSLDVYLKQNIIENFINRGCDVTVYPATTTAEEVLNDDPDLIFLSNGPGDPDDLDEIVGNVKKMIGKKPIVGICLGHQILARVFGGKTGKLKFGHRGGNHPVKDFEENKVFITAQNHGYYVTDVPECMNVTQVNLNDNTVEGMRHKELPIYSVQYHPEACPGPKDSQYIFDKFLDVLNNK